MWRHGMYDERMGPVNHAWSKRELASLQTLFVTTAVGLAATCSAPWMELRGTYASWRLDEWHTFWRGENAFQLSDVVAANYHVAVEFATADMSRDVKLLFALGLLLGAFYIAVSILLLAVGARHRRRTGVPAVRVLVELGAVVVINIVALYVLAQLLALPSSIALKVDFRTPGDIHTDSLVWSSLSVLPVAPVVAIGGALISAFTLVRARRLVPILGR